MSSHPCRWFAGLAAAVLTTAATDAQRLPVRRYTVADGLATTASRPSAAIRAAFYGSPPTTA